MLHQITYLLFKINLIQPSDKTISYWLENNDTEKIEYALEHGNYKTRQLAAEALEKIGNPSCIPLLLNAINDKVKNVSIAALNALEKIGNKDDLIKTIIKKRFNWVKRIQENNKKHKANKNKKYKIHKWKRASKKSFDRVKEQLKRPIR